MTYKKGSGNYKTQVVSTSVQKTTIVRNNDTSWVDTDMITPIMKIGYSYSILMNVNIKSPANADTKFLFNMGTMLADYKYWGKDVSGLNLLMVNPSSQNGNDTDNHEIIYAAISNVTQAGSIILQFAQETQQVADTSLFEGSFMTVTEHRK